ncbi:MAG: hypothetical protein HYV07_32185 [Deltaproteobacteria bacterium]|nr:hypothetical protein [Deltaproteobacteria bacterium]
MGVFDPKKQKFFNGPTIVGIIALSTLGYLGAFYLPHWFGVWRMTGAMKGVGFDSYKEKDLEKLYTRLLSDAKRLGLVGLVKEDFKIERIPYPPEELEGMGEYQVGVLRSRGKFVTIAMDYYVDAKWPLQDKTTELHFPRTVTVDMKTISW